MNNYQILLCENFYEEENFQEKEVCEIGSSSSSFLGKAFNVVFYTKIDGTHELSFELPHYYLDENTGEMKTNELVEFITNKNKLILKNIEENKEYHFVINKRTDKRDNGTFSYFYECTDAYIEELSKTGYGLSFTDEVDGGGLGTIHELAEKILENSGWEYSAEKTGKLLEYSTDLSYNREQRRYDTTYTPVPVHPIEYIEEVGRYCNRLIRTRNGKPIYCYEDTEQIVSSTVKNLLYNADEFIDLTGWTSFKKNGDNNEPGLTLSSFRKDIAEDETQAEYYLEISSNSSARASFILNDTAADSNKNISANQPYLFKYEIDSAGPNSRIVSIKIFDKNPLTSTVEASYDSGTVNYEPGKYYVIKTKTSFAKPYIVFEVRCRAAEDTSVQKIVIKNFSLFEVKGKETDGKTAEENNLFLISNLTNKMEIASNDSTYLPKMHLPQAEETVSAYTHQKVMYFYRNEDVDKTVTYLDFETEVNMVSGNVYKEIIVINKGEDFPAEPDLDKIYKYTDGKYYQYYQVTKNGVTGGAWDLALYGRGNSDKRRTLVAEKSNRFNLLQELSELFKVWCVFEVERDARSGRISKKVWFKEKAINENFSGFHAGINLHGLERIAESEEIVTKMFVEDIENDYAENGFVTIRTASMNPWGENYYYNFKYYVDQHLLNGEILDNDLTTLYEAVKGKNATIFDLNDKMASAAVELSKLSSTLKSIAYCIASCNERIGSIAADLLQENQLSKTDVKTLKSSKKTYKAQLRKYNSQKRKTQREYDSLKSEYDDWKEEVESLQEEKKELILNFENKYSQYIKEGVWSDSSYIDNNTYYLDSQKVSNTSAMPKTSWNISVIDGSIIEGLEDFKFSVGDQTILVDNEFFNIAPNAEENYVFEVLITGIREHLDDKTKTEIEVRNYLTSFEDIFQRISAATQTLELNEQTYDKAAYFKSDGTVDKDIIQSTLLQNALVLANSSDNSYVLDENGLSLQSLINPAKKMRAIADGIFFSNSTNITTGESEWKTGITAEGINASVITSGQLNTSLIKIYSDGQVNFSWGPEGITSYEPNSAEDSDSFIRLDGFGLYSVKDAAQGDEGFQLLDTGKPWFTGLTRNAALNRIVQQSIFSITDRGFRLNVKKDSGYIKLGYENDSVNDSYGLYIADNDGNIAVKLQNNGINSIAGWNMNYHKFESTEEGKGTFYIASAANTNYQNWLVAKDKENNITFRVSKEGFLYATGAEITGKISIEKGGTIGGWNINEKSISTTMEDGKRRMYLASAGHDSASYWILADDKDGNRTFSVSRDGVLYAKGAEIEGKITATEGSFSEKVTIGGTLLTAETLKNFYSNATGGSGTYITNIYAGGGSVGNWDIGKNTLSKTVGEASVTLNADDNDPSVTIQSGNASIVLKTKSYLNYGKVPTILFNLGDGESFKLFARTADTGGYSYLYAGYGDDMIPLVTAYDGKIVR